MTKKIFLAPFLTLFLIAGVVNAHTEDSPKPGMLPDSPFYFFETLSEGVGLFFTFGDIKKAERHLALASERLAEAEALAEQGKSNRAEKATEKYQERLDKALAKIDEAKEEGRDVNAVLEKIAEATVRHQVILAEVYDKVPEEAKEAIQKAMERSVRGHDTALNAVSEEKQKEVRDRVERETGAIEDQLEELRNQGIPIPEMDEERGRSGDDIEDDVDEEEVETEDDAAERPEGAGRPDSAGRP